jgi:eukaryotic-like serine/threonine-protein kinase
MSNAAQVEDLFFAALDKGTAAERAAYLDSACGGDAGLRRQVEKLLKAHPKVGDFLSKSAAEQLAAAGPPDATQEFDASTDGHGAGPAGRGGPALARTEGGRSGDDEDGALDFLQPSTRPDSLGRIGHYEILEVLGRGGFGIVFRAFDEVLQRVVAVKVLAPQLAVSSPPRKRFLREARSSARVRHESVVRVYAVEEQPLPYLVMEFIPGETLQQRLKRTGPMGTAEVVQIGRQIAEGLAAAHGLGLIHRDIKPGNILLEAGPHPRVKITDFGLARAADDASLTQSGIVAGTPMFMAPEQAQGETLDHRADLFCLGSVLYTMCTGRPPFRANSALAVLKRVAEDTPRPIQEIIPEVPQWLCAIIARLHAKKPEDRFASAQEVADLLARHPVAAPAAVGKGPPSRETPEAAPAIKSRGRTRRWVAAAALVLLLGGLSFTEATGVTNFRGTVIRLFTPEGTLVVEVNDPGVRVKIDGSELVITGAGAREIRLKPGRYTVEASKDGKVLRQELVTITNKGRQVVRVSREAPPDTKAAKAADGASAWERAVALLPAAQQVKFVAARLQELNPGFDGKVEPSIENGVVTGLEFSTEQVSDISPVRALTNLKNLKCAPGKLIDLSPLKGLKLATLDLSGTQVSDLSPLKGMPLTSLNFHTCPQIQDLKPLKGMPLTYLNLHDGPKVVDFSPLKGMPLTTLWAGGNLVRDLSPLKGLPLTSLSLSHCPEVQDLSPLKGLSLSLLFVDDTPVRDLAPLKDMPLKRLYVDAPGVTDLKPLQAMQLEDIRLTPQNVTQGLDILRNMKSLMTIGLSHYQAWPAAEFWARYDKGEFKK